MDDRVKIHMDPAELIEMIPGLVRSDLSITETFYSFIRPTVNPLLSQLCVMHTGITQDDVQKAATLEETMKSFTE